VGIEGRINKIENELRKSLNELRGEIEKVRFMDLDKLINETILTLDTRVKNIENNVNNFKTEITEINKRFDSLGKEIDSLKSRQPEDQRYFEMMFSAKLKEANENIIRHLKETQDRVNTALFEHNEDMKHFKNHITNFINESMVNYERRFELLQRNIEEKLKKIRSSGERALIVE
jgi:predicted  nucleic acid-binding Zn-ribbon protein